MKNSTLNVIKVIIALVLVAGMGVGLFFGGRWMIDKLDGIFVPDDPTVDEDGNTKLPIDSEESSGDQTQTPSDNGDNTPFDEEENLKFYIDDATGVGYSTVGNVTFFFKVYAPASNGYLNFWGVPLDSYDCNLRFSYDGILWDDSSYFNSDFDIYEASAHVDAGQPVYISYTTITNCEDPLDILNDLYANVFTNTGIFDWEYSSLAG